MEISRDVQGQVLPCHKGTRGWVIEAVLEMRGY